MTTPKSLAVLGIISVLSATMYGCGKQEEAKKEEAPAAKKAPTTGYDGSWSGAGGTISGVVTVTGAKPDAKVTSLPITKDEKVCGKGTKSSERFISGAGDGLANTIVWLDDIHQGVAMSWPESVTIDQKDCHYAPHIQLAKVGATLVVANDDPILHNIHGYKGLTKTDTKFNIATPTKGMKVANDQTKLDEKGMVSFVCDAGHSWMNAYIQVAEHPYYALTDKDGKFSLGNVPPGTYKIKYWHENWASTKVDKDAKGSPTGYTWADPYEGEASVTVAAGAAASTNFAIAAK